MRGGSFIDLTLDDESSPRNHQDDHKNWHPRGKRKMTAVNFIDTAFNKEPDCPLHYNQSIVQRLKEEAIESRFLRDAINRALPHIKQYGYPITNKKTALKVDGVGPMIANIIAAHLEVTGEATHKIGRSNYDLTHHAITNRQKKKRIYVPRRGKGGWALLFYMYITWMKTGRDTFRKEELQKASNILQTITIAITETGSLGLRGGTFPILQIQHQVTTINVAYPRIKPLLTNWKKWRQSVGISEMR